jgi:hypothetical protein
MLATQMAATHVAAMKYANRLAEAETLQEQDSAERAYNKLIRTFATLVEINERRRASSEKVAVQNVSVSSGGQAIIGNVTQPPLQPVLKLPDFRQAPMESIGESQHVPVRRRAKR